MRTPTRLLLPALAGLLLLAAACGGGSDDGPFPEVIEVGDNQVSAVFVTSELLVGDNRFVMGLLNTDGLPIVGADVTFRFYDLNEGGQVLKSDVAAHSIVPALDAGLAEQIEHIHPDGTKHVHFNAGGEGGVYVATANFDRPGTWGVEVEFTATDLGIKGVVRPRFIVLEQGWTPAIGEPAPRSHNLTAADVDDISEIDSSANPSEEMHTATIADTIEAGRPALVLFAVPGFCISRFCGPEMEIMRKLYPEYREDVEFIHIEFYKDPGSPERVPVEAVGEWGLRSEPWFFVIDSQGLVSAKFEGPTGIDELRAALDAVSAG
jgi:hypothetical protein